MRRSSLLLAAVLLAGCSSASMKEAPSADRSVTGTDQHLTDPATIRPQDSTKVTGDAAHQRPPESNDKATAAEPERAVTFPDSLELAPAPTFPERPRVAVAFVRGGKLVRRADALRRIAHEIEKDARVESLERLADDAPSQLSLEQLCDRAEKQGAVLLLLDVRATDTDAEKTTYVLSAKAPWKALALARPQAAEPAGQELVARLVRTSRTGP